jgi:hypothetical protein
LEFDVPDPQDQLLPLFVEDVLGVDFGVEDVKLPEL